MNNSQGSLTGRTAIASVWTIGSRFLAKLIDLLSLIVLARFLGPADFGLVALALTIMQVVEAISELPTVAVLVREPKVSDTMLSTAFTLGLIRGLIIAFLLFCFSWPFAYFYEESRLLPIIWVLAIAPVLRGLISPAMVFYARKLDFSRDLILEVCGKVLSFIVAVTIVVMTKSYWAMVASIVVPPLVMMVLSYFFAPMRISISLKSWSFFSHFVGWNTVGQFFVAINWQFDRFVIPLMTSAAQFGTYAMSANLVGIPQQAVVLPIMRPLLTGLTAAKANGRFEPAYGKAMSGLYSIMVPVFSFISLFSNEIIDVFLGEKWSEAAVILSGLVLAPLISLPSVSLPTIAILFGKVNYSTLFVATEFLFQIPLVLMGVFLGGISGVVIAKISIAMLSVTVATALIKRICGLSVRSQLAVSLRPLLSMILSAITVPLLVEAMNLDGIFSHSFFLLTACAVLFFGVYSFLLILSWFVCGQPDSIEALVWSKLVKLKRRGKR